MFFAFGLSRDVIDFFNEGELEKTRQKHNEQYIPSNPFSHSTRTSWDLSVLQKFSVR